MSNNIKQAAIEFIWCAIGALMVVAIFILGAILL